MKKNNEEAVPEPSFLDQFFKISYFRRRVIVICMLDTTYGVAGVLCKPIPAVNTQILHNSDGASLY